jgi:electron transfer flavoprotein alpha subunit
VTVAEMLVYSERPQTALELLSKGGELAPALGLTLTAAALGPGAAAEADALGAAGAERIYVCEEQALGDLPVDALAGALAQLVRQNEVSCVLLGSTRRGRELAGRLAQKLDAGCVTDVNSLALEDGALVAGRYALGGNTVQRETVETPVKVFAVMPKTFEAGQGKAGAGEVVRPSLQVLPSFVKVVERRPKEGAAVNLDAAERIVCVGRGFAKREDLPIGEQLATALGAELACTKSLADFQWLPEERIIGLSGAKATPELYLGLGVSGQIQHTVGISAAKLIAAVNKDKDAPIFALADYGIVGDLYQVVPALIEKLKAV